MRAREQEHGRGLTRRRGRILPTSHVHVDLDYSANSLSTSLLEWSTQQTDFGPVMLTLAMLLQMGNERVERDEGKAQTMLRIAHTEDVWEYEDIRVDFWTNIGRDERDQLQWVMGQIPETGIVKMRYCFLLVFGGAAAHGRSSVVQSLRSTKFVKEHRPTELIELNSFSCCSNSNSKVTFWCKLFKIVRRLLLR